ncbi:MULTISPECIES: histidine kinase [unclassified Arenimonas]|uniref:sensor histidine kinase n=1 Tax=unclassified Arenimonas TaxID=2641713 RepID=UPI00086C8281|nr:MULTISPECIES: histidine kinase [unclassified Arenimonas]ODS63499.1 MAG: histidine kinase [Arenimonas sp. SCN 70-307]
MTRTPPHPARPLDVLWQANAILWVILGGEGLAAVLALAPGLAADRLTYFGLASLWIQWTALLTLAVLYLARRWLNRLPPPQVAAVALVVGLALCWLITVVIRAYLEPGQAPGRVDWLALALQVSGITLTFGLLGLAAFHNHWKGRLAAVRAKQAELEALQARIRPHFLFNTLNTGAALVHARPQDAEQLLLDLADLFRAALSGPTELPLRDELSLARRYLEIERLRFGDRLQVQWTLPETLPEVVVPALSVQPLVENAIRHGIEPSPSGGRLDVVVVVEPDEVRVVVSNDLPPSGTRPAAGHQVGLASARERIEALSQGRGHLQTRVAAGRYVATITLPL